MTKTIEQMTAEVRADGCAEMLSLLGQMERYVSVSLVENVTGGHMEAANRDADILMRCRDLRLSHGIDIGILAPDVRRAIYRVCEL